MGYGVVRIDFNLLKQVFRFPEGCEITAVQSCYTGKPFVELVISSPELSAPFSIEKALPVVPLIGKIEPCPEHGDCPSCRKISAYLKLPERGHSF